MLALTKLAFLLGPGRLQLCSNIECGLVVELPRLSIELLIAIFLLFVSSRVLVWPGSVIWQSWSVRLVCTSLGWLRERLVRLMPLVLALMVLATATLVVLTTSAALIAPLLLLPLALRLLFKIGERIILWCSRERRRSRLLLVIRLLSTWSRPCGWRLRPLLVYFVLGIWHRITWSDHFASPFSFSTHEMPGYYFHKIDLFDYRYL